MKKYIIVDNQESALYEEVEYMLEQGWELLSLDTILLRRVPIKMANEFYELTGESFEGFF